jgi:hypothetical protein
MATLFDDFEVPMLRNQQKVPSYSINQSVSTLGQYHLYSPMTHVKKTIQMTQTMTALPCLMTLEGNRNTIVLLIYTVYTHICPIKNMKLYPHSIPQNHHIQILILGF